MERVVRLANAHADLLLAVGIGVLAQLEIWSSSASTGERAAYALLAGVAAAALAFRRRWPLGVLAFVVAAGAVGAAAIEPASGDDSLVLALTLVICVYSAGAYTAGRRAVVGALAPVLLAGVVVVTDPEPVDAGNFAFFLLLFAGPWLAGAAIRRRRSRERELIVEREQRARAAVLEERTRIARELHDVVAHAISVIVLQARGARHSLDAEPAEARTAVEAIERTASAALAEMRRLLGLLRAGEDDVALGPQPSLAHLQTLAAQVRDAGLPTELRFEGEVRPVPPGVDLSAYRIVQEALTNALKHAGPAKARVLVRFGADVLELEVADTGAGAANGDGSGHGLVGMRERVALFGGTLQSGPGAEGGFAVRARLPL